MNDPRLVQALFRAVPIMWLAEPGDNELVEALRRITSSGRPRGGADFIRRLESLPGSVPAPRKPGPEAAEESARQRFLTEDMFG